MENLNLISPIKYQNNKPYPYFIIEDILDS